MNGATAFEELHCSPKWELWARTGRNRNSRSRLRNGNKQTFVAGIASGWSRPNLVIGRPIVHSRERTFNTTGRRPALRPWLPFQIASPSLECRRSAECGRSCSNVGCADRSRQPAAYRRRITSPCGRAPKGEWFANLSNQVPGDPTRTRSATSCASLASASQLNFAS